MKIVLKHVPLPSLDFPAEAPVVPAEEYERRIASLLEKAGTDWVLVYADREHYANLTHLVNFDPRFEEALLVLSRQGRRVLIVGNEGLGYVPILSVPVEVELCQTFSLNSQPRATSARLKDTLAHTGIAAGHSVCVVGWKYLETWENDDIQTPAFIPAYYLDLLRQLVGSSGRLVDGSALMMHPETGLRATNSASQIAAFEWGARHASAAVFSILRHARPGMSEMQALQWMQYAGLPMSMHPIFVSGKGEINGLRSPSAKLIEYGDGVSTGLGYWGSLVCRAGMMLGQPDSTYFEQVAAPYFRAIATWYQTVSVGVPGGVVFAAVAQAFEGSPMRSSLNPGHLTSFDEWLSSPIRPDSRETIRSGMVFQCDIIPTPLPPGQLTNCEDTVAFADASLRAELRAAYPDLWRRVEARRQIITEALGIRLADDLLPLTDCTACLPPFWLAPDLVCAVA